MTRADLIDRIAARHPELMLKDAEAATKLILDAMLNALENGRVEIRGFGSFDKTLRPPRNARNPKTGEPVAIPAKLAPRFKAGKELKERVNYAK